MLPPLLLHGPSSSSTSIILFPPPLCHPRITLSTPPRFRFSHASTRSLLSRSGSPSPLLHVSAEAFLSSLPSVHHTPIPSQSNLHLRETAISLPPLSPFALNHVTCSAPPQSSSFCRSARNFLPVTAFRKSKRQPLPLTFHFPCFPAQSQLPFPHALLPPAPSPHPEFQTVNLHPDLHLNSIRPSLANPSLISAEIRSGIIGIFPLPRSYKFRILPNPLPRQPSFPLPQTFTELHSSHPLPPVPTCHVTNPQTPTLYFDPTSAIAIDNFPTC